ncbi:MAG: hypothetical protein JWR32_2546 [Mycobacterium sp.]|jgi:hypothetical protein|nr:hypothetical protein [Mycobacterium sp.]
MKQLGPFLLALIIVAAVLRYIWRVAAAVGVIALAVALLWLSF